MFFNIFSKTLQKALVFQCFLHSELKKQRKTNGFAIFSAKYSKKHRFYKVFEHSGCKNEGKQMVFHYFQQNIAKSTGFIMLSSFLDAKTKENPWFSNIFSKIQQKHRFHKVFEHSGCKNQGKPMVFQHSQQNIAKKHRFYNVFEHSGCKNQGKQILFPQTVLALRGSYLSCN